MTRIVPFKRVLHKGDKGPDVLAVKRALWRANIITRKKGEPFTRLYGPYTVEAMKIFERKKNLHVDGVYELGDHRKLMPYFDDYGAWLMGQSPGNKPEVTLRDKVVSEALWGFNNRSQIHYEQIRPMRSIHQGHYLPQTMDCSEFATVCYYRAGAPDPNARGYDGFGYTGTLVAQGKSVTLGEARPGDLVFYGPGWPFTHVTIYAGNGRCYSHGSEVGPNLVSIDYRNDRKAIQSYL